MDIDPGSSQNEASKMDFKDNKDHFHSPWLEREPSPLELSPLLNVWKDLWDLNGDISISDANCNTGVTIREESARVIVDQSYHICNDEDMEINNLADSLSNIIIT